MPADLEKNPTRVVSVLNGHVPGANFSVEQPATPGQHVALRAGAFSVILFVGEMGRKTLG